MIQRLFLGIDTSNYTTSLALCGEDGEIKANIKRLLPVKDGECGLRQSDAVFSHIKALPELSTLVSQSMGGGILSAVGVSVRPRNRAGSYMPCFLVGRSAAYSAALAAHAPVHEFSHQCGHLMAAAYSCGGQALLDGRLFGAFHVSGGTTEMLTAKFDGIGFVSEIIGGTADISAGQLIDRAGVLMGLGFPCGPELEKLSLQNTKPLPHISIKATDGKVNLSGYENKISQIFATTGDRAYTAAYTLHAVAAALSSMLTYMQHRFGRLPVLFSGGVMSCTYLRRSMESLCTAYTAEPAYSSDNAAGIALLCRRAALAAQGEGTV